MSATRTRLSRTDWTDAALGAMATHGVAGVNVEQLARDLHTTKGSFYHHFENRQSLIDAALARFVEIVESDLADAQPIEDPRARLLESSLAGVGSPIDGLVDLALAASADDPPVAETLRALTEVRLEYLAQALRDLGFSATEARARAEVGLATYLGLFHLQRVSGGRFHDDDLRDHITRAVDTMVARR